jgi:hypothetical protein
MNRKIVIFLILVCITSCNVDNNQDEVLPSVSMATGKMNNDLVLMLSTTSEYDYIETNSIYMQAQNKSSIPILVNLKTGIKIFHKESNEWVQIPNNLSYQEGEIAILPKSLSPMGIDIITRPDYCILQQKE